MMFSHAIRSQSCRHILRQAVLSYKTGARSLASKPIVPEIDIKARALKTTFNLPDPAEVNAHQLTKIVATIGPTSEQEEPLKKVVEAGMKIMRLNFSHATTEEVELRLKNLALSQVRKTRQSVLEYVHNIGFYTLLYHYLQYDETRRSWNEEGLKHSLQPIFDLHQQSLNSFLTL